MSYLVQSRLAEDQLFSKRVTACAAVEGVQNPEAWAWDKRWELSARPGWVTAYRDAGQEPGANEDAITDTMILAAVQELQEGSEQ